MERTIAVRANARKSLKVDYISLNLSLNAKNKDYGKAYEEGCRQLEEIQNAIIEFGYKKKDLKTTYFNVRSDYTSKRDENGDYIQVFDGYVVNQNLLFEFDFDSNRLSEILSRISATTSNPQLNVQFTVKDKDQYAKDLLKMLASDAKAKAKILATGSKVKLGKIISIDYANSDYNFVSNTSYDAISPKMARMECAGYNNNMDFTAEDIVISDSAVFVYEIVE